jgi:PAS domain S-box-containing protein
MRAAKQVRVTKLAKPARTPNAIDQLLAVAPDAMVITGADGRMAHVNTQAEKLLGYSEEQLLGQRIDLLMPKPPKQHKGKHGRQPEIRPFGHGFETMVRRRNGTELPVVINLGFLEVGADTLISSAFREIQPEPSEELNLRALVDASDDAIIGKTLDGTIVSWNKGAEKIYGYKAEEILGLPISVLIPPGHSNELPEIMMRLRRGDHIGSFETTRIHKDGHLIDVSVTISPVKSKTGIVVGASVVARDITQQKQAQNALRLSEDVFVLLSRTRLLWFSVRICSCVTPGSIRHS